MATKSLRYDHPQYTVHQMAAVKLPVSAASAVAGKFFAFTGVKIHKVWVSVDIQGTSTAGWDILTGTSATVTSEATVFVATNAPGYTGTNVLESYVLASGGYLAFRANPSQATGAGSAMIEFSVTPGSAITDN